MFSKRQHRDYYDPHGAAERVRVRGRAGLGQRVAAGVRQRAAGAAHGARPRHGAAGGRRPAHRPPPRRAAAAHTRVRFTMLPLAKIYSTVSLIRHFNTLAHLAIRYLPAPTRRLFSYVLTNEYILKCFLYFILFFSKQSSHPNIPKITHDGF